MDILEKENLRHSFDSKSDTLYVSIVDVIEMLGLSTDSRNYWKTLKNRLNKAQNKLVTRCNQLKMPANDGKMYLTDVIDEDGMLLLIQHIAPNKVSYFRTIFTELVQKSHQKEPLSLPGHNELSTVEHEDFALSLDLYEKDNHFIIYVMLAGTEPAHVSLVTTCKNILIKGYRKRESITDAKYLTNELAWGTFSREIEFLKEVDLDNIETTFTHGMLIINLPIMDKSRTKVIQIK